MNTRTRQGERSREAILEAAALAIARKGFGETSMRDLARATGKALATFYHHFASKEELLLELQVRAFDTLIVSVERGLGAAEDPVSRLHAFIASHVRYVVKHPDVMRVLVSEAATLPSRRRAVVRARKERYFAIGRGLVEDVVRTARAGGGTGTGADPLAEVEVERATYSLFGMLNWVYGWYDPERHGAPEEVARTIHRISLGGIVANGDHRPLQERTERTLDRMDRAAGSEAPSASEGR